MPSPGHNGTGGGLLICKTEPGTVPMVTDTGKPASDSTAVLPKPKNSNRRNAWGPHSYADLITQAILSSPEKRLTLAQVYDWMVTNIPWFKDKGDSTSSAGWKVGPAACVCVMSVRERMGMRGWRAFQWSD